MARLKSRVDLDGRYDTRSWSLRMNAYDFILILFSLEACSIHDPKRIAKPVDIESLILRSATFVILEIA